jgi:(p)ppGpp synthase/HD superfamily hydrolase
MDLIESAMKFSMQAHLTQKRKGSGIPYFTHCVEVMKAVSDFGVRDEGILVAALLHDVHEDSPNDSDYVKDLFGNRVYRIMIECSRPERDDATKEEKFNFLCSFAEKSTSSIVIKIADRYCNVNDYLRTKGKEKYASTYALQAFPIYAAFVERAIEGIAQFEEDVTKKILMMIANLQTVARMEYPQCISLSLEEIRKLVI